MDVTGEDGGPIQGERTLNAWLESINGKTLGPASERVGVVRDVIEEQVPRKGKPLGPPSERNES